MFLASIALWYAAPGPPNPAIPARLGIDRRVGAGGLSSPRDPRLDLIAFFLGDFQVADRGLNVRETIAVMPCRVRSTGFKVRNNGSASSNFSFFLDRRGALLRFLAQTGQLLFSDPYIRFQLKFVLRVRLTEPSSIIICDWQSRHLAQVPIGLIG